MCQEYELKECFNIKIFTLKTLIKILTNFFQPLTFFIKNFKFFSCLEKKIIFLSKNSNFFRDGKPNRTEPNRTDRGNFTGKLNRNKTR